MIAELKPRYIVTTNYDLLIENALYLSGDVTLGIVASTPIKGRYPNSPRTEIFKMHGSFAPARQDGVAVLYPGFNSSHAEEFIVISETDYDECTAELIRSRKRSALPIWHALTNTLLIVGKAVLWEDLSFMWALRQRSEMKSKGTKCGPAWWLVEDSLSLRQYAYPGELGHMPNKKCRFPVQKDPNGAHHYFANVRALQILFEDLLPNTPGENDAIDKRKWDFAYGCLVSAPDIVAIGLTALNTMGCPNTAGKPPGDQSWWGTTPLPREGRQNLSLDGVEQYAGGPALTALSVCAALCASRTDKNDSVRCALVSVIGDDDAGKRNTVIL